MSPPISPAAAKAIKRRRLAAASLAKTALDQLDEALATKPAEARMEVYRWLVLGLASRMATSTSPLRAAGVLSKALERVLPAWGGSEEAMRSIELQVATFGARSPQ